MKNVPLLILANKQDIEGSLTDVKVKVDNKISKISETLGLSNIKNRQWGIFKTCGKSGKGLDDAFKW